ncbi:MAG: pantoate--beta-alanine ligase, partial [Bacteroidales bacterium]|nr:pantoate--beta-alanine ligase [Bacteroidales bacterium]
EVDEMYPSQDNRVFEFDGLDAIMEGKHRPGHFNGVAQIVTKLFDMVTPDRAYFGEKDYQQLAIIKRLVRVLNYSIEIVAVPTVREKDGLAMSSRNQLLKNNYRKAAPIIYKSLSSIKEMMVNNSPDDIRKYIEEEFLNNDLLEMEYFELVNSSTLQPIKDWSQDASITACIAVQAGQVRLIDNITIN